MKFKVLPYPTTTIVDYVFGDLSPQEEGDFAQVLAKDDYFFQVIEGLIDYCMAKRLSKEALTQVIERNADLLAVLQNS